MSKFAPSTSSFDARIKFAEVEIYAEYNSTYNSYSFTFEILPHDLSKQPYKKFMYNSKKDYQNVTWPSILEQVKAGAIKSEDDLITELGEPPKRFYASFQTPLYLTQATAKQIEKAKGKDRTADDLQLDEKSGMVMFKNYPIKFVKIYPTKEAYESDAEKAQNETPAPSQPEVAQSPEYQQILAMLPIFVNNCGLDLHKLEVSLANPPLSTYFTIASPEVKLEVARAVITKVGPTDENAIKGVLIGLNGGGYLDIDSPEIKAMRSEVAF